MSEEDDLRSALAARTAGVDESSLLRPEPPALRPPHRWPAALLAVAAVGLLLLPSGTGRRQRSAGLADRSGTSEGAHVTLDLAGNQTLMFDDSVNVTSGDYRVTATGLQVGMMGQTAAGYSGHDAVIIAAQQAVSAVAVGVAVGNQQHAIAARLDGDRLTLSSGSAAIVYVRDGPSRRSCTRLRRPRHRLQLRCSTPDR